MEIVLIRVSLEPFMQTQGIFCKQSYGIRSSYPNAINFYDLLCRFFAFLAIFLSSFFLVCQDCVWVFVYTVSMRLLYSSSSFTLSPLSYFNCDFQLTLLRLSFIRACNLSWHISSHVCLFLCVTRIYLYKIKGKLVCAIWTRNSTTTTSAKI